MLYLCGILSSPSVTSDVALPIAVVLIIAEALPIVPLPIFVIALPSVFILFSRLSIIRCAVDILLVSTFGLIGLAFTLFAEPVNFLNSLSAVRTKNVIMIT